MTPALTDIVRIHGDAVWRDVDGEVVVLNVVSGQYYGLDGVGSRIWHLLEGDARPLSALRDALLVEYDADPSIIERDLVALAGRLADLQLVTLQN